MATVAVDIPATQVVMVNPEGGGTIVTGELANMDNPGDIVMVSVEGSPSTTLNVSQWGSGPADDSFTLPPPPAGFPTLTAAYYAVMAYRPSGETRSIFPTPSFGLMPEPEDSPFLQANAGANPMCIDHIPAGGFSGAVTLCRVSESLTALASGRTSGQWTVGASDGAASYDAHMHIGYFGIRLVYSDGGADDEATVYGPIVRRGFSPLRQYPRSDGRGANPVRRAYPPTPSIQQSNRRAGGYL